MTYLEAFEEGPRLVRRTEAADSGNGFVAYEQAFSIDLFWLMVIFLRIGDKFIEFLLFLDWKQACPLNGNWAACFAVV